MPAVTRSHVPALILIFVGLGVVLLGFHLYPNHGETEYSLTVRPMGNVDVPEGTDVMDYEDLSPQGQRAIQVALESPDERVVLYGDSYGAYDLPYGHGEGAIYLAHGEERYRVSAYEQSSFVPVRTILLSLFVAVGLVYVVFGASSVRTGRPRVPVAILVGTATLAGAVVLNVDDVLGPGSFETVATGLVSFAVPAAIAWRLLGYSRTWAR